MLADSLIRARVAACHWPLISILAAASICLSLGGTSLFNSVNADVARLLMFFAALAFFFTNYLLARVAGRAHESEQGSAFSFLGWIFLAVMPLVIALLSYAGATGFDRWIEAQYPRFAETLITTITLTVATPIFVVAGGRAINGDGPQAGKIMFYTLDGRIFLNAFLLVAIPGLILGFIESQIYSKPLSAFAEITSSIILGLCWVVTTLLYTGLYASIYRAAESEIGIGGN